MSSVAMDKALILASKYALPIWERGARDNHGLQFTLARIYWQGVLHGAAAMNEAGEGSDDAG